MDYGIHLPLLDFGGNPFTLDHLLSCVEAGQALGFRGRAANDHLVFSRPWLDRPTHRPGRGDLAFGQPGPGDDGLLPVVGGPVPLAKSLA